MEGKRIVFVAPNQVALESFEYDLDGLRPDEVAIRVTHSLISPGTELACLRGVESWAPLPFVPGYAGCGEVIAVGPDVQGIHEGDRVFSYTKHASLVTGRQVVKRIPEGLDETRACFARMAAVSITALRVSEAELGDYVAVIGLGLVGNLCAQLFALAGCDVVGIDLSPRRCAIARECGIQHAIDPREVDPQEYIAGLTDGAMCNTVVEAIGNPRVTLNAPAFAGKLGEVILLGSPRDRLDEDITPFLQRIHLWSHGCITIKGAHEWRYPVSRDPSGHVKHSIERNVEILLRLIANGQLHIDPLLTHVLPPSACAEAYRGLRDDPESYLGVVFDWSQLA